MGNKILLEMDRDEATAVVEALAGNPITDKISISLRNALGEPEIHVYYWEDDEGNEWRIFHKDGEAIRFEQAVYTGDGVVNWETKVDLSSDVDIANSYKDGTMITLLEELAITLLTHPDNDSSEG